MDSGPANWNDNRFVILLLLLEREVNESGASFQFVEMVSQRRRHISFEVSELAQCSSWRRQDIQNVLLVQSALVGRKEIEDV
jgi:hypothetical protein